MVIAVPIQASSGPEGSRKLRFPDFVTKAQDGGSLSALITGRRYPRKCSWYLFLLEDKSTPGPQCDRKDFMSMKNPLTPAGIEPATFRCVAQHNPSFISVSMYWQPSCHLSLDLITLFVAVAHSEWWWWWWQLQEICAVVCMKAIVVRCSLRSQKKKLFRCKTLPFFLGQVLALPHENAVDLHSVDVDLLVTNGCQGQLQTPQ